MGQQKRNREDPLPSQVINWIDYKNRVPVEKQYTRLAKPARFFYIRRKTSVEKQYTPGKKEYAPEIQAARDRADEAALKHKRTRQVYDPEVKEFLIQSDALEEFLAGNYRLGLPVSKFEDRKKVDYEIYQQERDDYFAILTRNKVPITDEDTAIHRKTWLKERIEVIESQLSPTHPNGKIKHRSDYRQVDSFVLTKYQYYLESEINTIEGNKEQQAPQPIDQKPTEGNGKNDSKRPAARVFANFTDKLINDFTENDLNNLLRHIGFKNENGETLKFTSYLMHDLIDALIAADYFEEGNRENDQKALQRFLGLPQTRVVNGYGSRKSVRSKADVYLSNLKKQRENNR